jgi:hypothetical protein
LTEYLKPSPPTPTPFNHHITQLHHTTAPPPTNPTTTTRDKRSRTAQKTQKKPKNMIQVKDVLLQGAKWVKNNSSGRRQKIKKEKNTKKEGAKAKK